MNLRILTKNHAADPEIGSLTKSISEPYGRATAMPSAWELKMKNQQLFPIISVFPGHYNNHWPSRRF